MLAVFDNIADMATGSAFSILTGDVEHSIAFNEACIEEGATSD